LNGIPEFSHQSYLYKAHLEDREKEQDHGIDLRDFGKTGRREHSLTWAVRDWPVDSVMMPVNPVSHVKQLQS